MHALVLAVTAWRSILDTGQVAMHHFGFLRAELDT
jgi:hypothetical protein